MATGGIFALNSLLGEEIVNYHEISLLSMENLQAKFDYPSIIVPVYNGAGFIENSVKELHSFLTSTFAAFELIIVNDGSRDRTADVLSQIKLPGVTIENLPKNLGKFGAIRQGMIRATGNSCIFFDGDLPYDLSALPYIHHLISERKIHVVIGDRTLDESRYLSMLTPIRRLSSQIFPVFVRLLVTGGLFDTQCGLKGFRNDVAKAIFAITIDNGFSGDVEVLYLALKYNLEIKRIPVRLMESQTSSIRIIRDALKMILECIKLPPRWRCGHYQSVILKQISSQAYWNDRL